MNVLKFGLSMSLLSGHSRPAFELANYLSKNDVNVLLLSSQLDKKRDLLHQELLEKEGLSVRCYRPFTSVMNFITQSRKCSIKRIFSWADIIHVYGIYSLFLLREFAPPKAKIVYSANSAFNVSISDLASSGLLSLRNLTLPGYLVDIFLPNIFYSHALSCADKIICWTKFMQSKIRTLGTFNCEYIPVGVNLERFKVTENDVVGDFVFLYLGYLASARGVADLLEAFEIVNREWPSTKLLISHTGMHPSEQNVFLNRMSKSKSLRNIDIVGFSSDLSKVINTANAVVLPFRTAVGYSQPPLVVLETLAAGRPVISTSVGCLPEIIRDGINGFCIPPRNPRQLAKTMLQMREADLSSMSKNAFEFVSRNHNWQKISESTVKVYDEVLRERN